MAQIYSKPFVVQKGLSGAGSSVVVPAGRVYIVKEVTIYASPLLGLTTIFLEHEPTGAALIAQDASLTSSLWFGFFGSLVFDAGEGFHFQVNSSFGEAADVSAHGYDLAV